MANQNPACIRDQNGKLPFKNRRVNPEGKALQTKDIILMLIFLGAIAAVYTNINERLVKLEVKGDMAVVQITEIKVETSKALLKLDENTRNIQAQLRDLEQLVLMSKGIK